MRYRAVSTFFTSSQVNHLPEFVNRYCYFYLLNTINYLKFNFPGISYFILFYFTKTVLETLRNVSHLYPMTPYDSMTES